MTLAALWSPGIGELIVILVIIMIFFGVGKLPQIGAALGKGLKNFKSASDGSQGELDVTPEGDSKDG